MAADGDDERVLRDLRAQGSAQTDQILAAALGSVETIEALAEAGQAVEKAVRALMEAGVDHETATGTLGGMVVSMLVRIGREG